MIFLPFIVLLFTLVFSETVHEHRQNSLKEIREEEFQFYDESTKLIITLQPTQRVLFSKNETVNEDKVYVYFDDPALSFLQFGKTMEYNSSKIYGNYFHTELYKITVPTSITEPILRVNYVCCSMHSLEHHLEFLQSPLNQRTFIYSFQSIPSLRISEPTIDLNVCAIQLCDQFSDDQIKSFTPFEPCRYNNDSHIVSQKERQEIVNEIQELFLHGYKHYLYDAFPYPQLDPLTCTSTHFAQSDLPYMTIIDTLDTLHVLGHDDLFVDGVRKLEKLDNFDIDENVSVFETTIRFLGGLLSAHMFLIDNSTILQQYNQQHPKNIYQYKGHLLDLAIDLGKRLLPAFQSNGLAYGSINLHKGVLPQETPVSSLAGIGSSLLEFATLSSLTNDLIYLDTVRKCMLRLFELRSPYDHLGKHIHIQTQQWTEKASCFGRNSDSYYEYLLKGYILLNDPQLYDMFMTLYYSFDTYNKANTVHWYGVTDIDNPHIRYDQSYSLSAFWPGVQFLLGDYIGGKTTLMRFLYVWDYYGYLPEFFSIMDKDMISGGENYPLRPELIESMMYHDIVFHNNEMIYWGKMILHQLKNTKTKCGFASIKNIRTGLLVNEMPSYMLSETLKYLYLLYDNSSVYRGKEWLFTTEGHVMNITHIQSNPIIRSYIEDMNSLYEENTSTQWDLQCNAGYQSDYQILSKDLEKSSHYKHAFPYQCPVIKDEEILQRWYVYEDLIYYSYNNDTWRSFFEMSGSDRFPSSSIPSSIPPAPSLPTEQEDPTENKEHMVTIKLGDQSSTVQMKGNLLGNLLQFLSGMNKDPKDQSEEEKKRLDKIRQELLKSLSSSLPIKQQKQRESYIDEEGYRVSEFDFIKEKVTIRMKKEIKYDIMNSDFRLGINTISTSKLIVNYQPSSEKNILFMVERDADKAIQNQIWIQIGNQVLPCFSIAYYNKIPNIMDEESNMPSKDKEFLDHGIVCEGNSTLLLLKHDCNNMMEIPIIAYLIDPSQFAWIHGKDSETDLYISKKMIETMNDKQIKEELVKSQYHIYPLNQKMDDLKMYWFKESAFFEVNSFTFAIIDTIVKKNHLLISYGIGKHSLMRTIETMDTKEIEDEEEEESKEDDGNVYDEQEQEQEEVSDEEQEEVSDEEQEEVSDEEQEEENSINEQKQEVEVDDTPAAFLNQDFEEVEEVEE